MRWRGRLNQIFIIILTVILAAALGALLFISRRQDRIRAEEARKMQADYEERLDTMKQELSFQLLTGDTWEKNKLGECEVILDTDNLLKEAVISSAVYNNASVSWRDDRASETYVWRFSIKTESSAKAIKIFNGAGLTEYTVYPQETLFYIPAEGKRFKIELEGGADEFECLSICDVQLVKPVENMDLNGQYLAIENAAGIVREVGYTAGRMASVPGAVKEKEAWLRTPDIVKLKGDKLEAELYFEFSEVNTDERTLLLGLSAGNPGANGTMRFCVGDGYQATRFVNPQMQEYIFPLRNMGAISECKVTVELPAGDWPDNCGSSDMDGSLNVSALAVYTTNETDGTVLPGGSYMLDQYEKVSFDTSRDTLPAMTDSFILGDYLYGVGGGSLLIYDIKEGSSNPKLTAALGGLGNTREVVSAADGTVVAVSARENGVWLIDVTEASNPEIISHYDSLEFATGICSYGNYLAVCSRYWGVELIDISDPANPKWCSTVSGKSEYYDCYIYEGYLYVSVWAQKRVDVYELANVYEPKLISDIDLDGNGGGITASDGVLYVATGYNGAGSAENAFSASFGTGNGLELYDISDPFKIRWLSASKIDGRYYTAGYDHWDVTVSSGRAYFSSVANGLYVYDVTNPSAPIRLAHINGGGV